MQTYLPPKGWEVLTLLRFPLSLSWGVGHFFGVWLLKCYFLSLEHILKETSFCFCTEDYLRSAFIQLSSQQIFIEAPC